MSVQTPLVDSVVSNPVSQITAVPPRSAAALDASLVRGIAWTSGTKWLSQIATWVCTLAVARLLTPADYGLVGMAVLYMQFVTLINELGLGAAIVAKQTLTSHQIAQLNSLSVLLGVAAFAVSCGAAVPLSIFFNAPELRLIVLVMTISCIIGAFRAVPSALLQRELRFKTLAVIEGLEAVAGGVIVLILALLGFGYWALVLGGVLGQLGWTIMVLSQRSHAYAWPRLGPLRDALAFSWQVLVSRLCWYAQTNGDYVVAGRVFGKELLGAYTLSFTIATIPTSKITSLIGRVTFPFFSAIQDDRAALRRYLLVLTKGLALLTFPLAFGLSLVADDLVLGVLGQKWQAAIAPLRCLAFLILLRAIVPLLPQILHATGEARYAMRVGLVSGAVLPLAFYLGTHWGIVGVAAVWVTVYPFATIPYYWRVFTKLELPVGEYLRALWPAMSASLLMGAAVWMLRDVLPTEWSHPVRLGVQVVIGGVVYVGALFTLYSGDLHAFRRALEIVRGQQGVVAAAGASPYPNP